MRAAVHVIPCAGVLAEAGRAASRSGRAGSGLATAALRTAERLEAPADLVLIAVPAGDGHDLADRLLAAGDRALDAARARR
jgi:hypothetical protein